MLACGRVLTSPIWCGPRRSRQDLRMSMVRGRARARARAKLIHQDDDDDDDGDGDDPFYQEAIKHASLRWQETHRPDPLFIDPYDKLLTTLNSFDGTNQVVLLTDGADTRPYRLNWPRSTVIFEVSPESIFGEMTEKLEAVGAKVPRSCFLLHVPSESSSIQHTLCGKGFNGARPSIWALQGLPIRTLASFKEVLSLVGSLAMKDCLFIGELPAWLVDSDTELKDDVEVWMEKIFLSNGFRVNTIWYDEVGRNLGTDLASEDYGSILFVAQYLRFSDAQMDAWIREFQRIEEEGDEEGFEEL